MTFSKSWVISNRIKHVDIFYYCPETQHILWKKATWGLKCILKLFKRKLYHSLYRLVILKWTPLLKMQNMEPSPNL